MVKYTLGFIFTRDLKKVLLIKKLHPKWQRGKLNGLGGKIEKGETTLESITREVKEESDLDIEKTAWLFIGIFNSSEWIVEIFASLYKGNPNDAKSIEKEKVKWVNAKNLPKNALENLQWLLPFILFKLQTNSKQTFTVKY